MKVAIVDDELKMRQIMTDYVKRFGEEAGIELETVTFESGEQFLKDYKMIYDIIIFDIDMPGINGIDTARKLRETDTNVTIIFVTNIAQYAINGYEVDAVDYILKPVSYYDFSMKFHRTVAKAAQKKEPEGCGFRRWFMWRFFPIIFTFTPRKGITKSGEILEMWKKSWKNTISFGFIVLT